MKNENLPQDVFDIAVIGAGAAGMMAAIRAGQLKKNVILLERNASIGCKLLLTGKGRCNLTNTAPAEEFMEKFGKNGPFLRSAFFEFFNNELMDFFKNNGLALKTERQGRVFPECDRASSVVNVLGKALTDNKVRVLCGCRLMGLIDEGGLFRLRIEEGEEILAKKVVLATGGASYKKTGSTGDGFHIAKTLKHTYTALKPGLVPLRTGENWIRDLQGLSLKNVRVIFEYDNKKITSEVGEMLFTHFGVSGPLVLDLSNRVSELLWDKKQVDIAIDLKPGLTGEQVEAKLLRQIEEHGSLNVKNTLKEMLPLKMVPIFINLLKLNSAKRINQLTQQERRGIVNLLKAFKLKITGTLPLEEAMITLGGIQTKEINPRTMESRITPGLYFAGEIIDAHAPSGGYNLQQAFSTGYLAGEKAAECVK